jgi:hypothetical protein
LIQSLNSSTSKSTLSILTVNIMTQESFSLLSYFFSINLYLTFNFLYLYLINTSHCLFSTYVPMLLWSMVFPFAKPPSPIIDGYIYTVLFIRNPVVSNRSYPPWLDSLPMYRGKLGSEE